MPAGGSTEHSPRVESRLCWVSQKVCSWFSRPSYRKTQKGFFGQPDASMRACEVASVVSDSVTPGTVAHQAPLSMGLSKQEYWSRLPCPPPGDLPNPGIEPVSLTFPALEGKFFTASATWEAQ